MSRSRDHPPSSESVARAQADHGLFVRVEPILPGQPGGALSGWTIGLKDNIGLAGRRMTAGMASGPVVETDARVAERLGSAGAARLGHLNMDEAALGAATDNPHHGRTRNPRNPGAHVGGSSGGSAAAVACGLVRAALGSDTLGSIRIPAAWCGVAGLKPTFGLVPRTGVRPLAPGLDVVGPLADRVADLWPVLAAILGEDAADPDCLPPPAGFGPPPAPGRLTGIVIGVPRAQASGATPAVMHALSAATELLRDHGIEVRDIAMPEWRPGKLRGATFLMLEAEAAVSLAADHDRLSPATIAALRYGAGLSSARLVAAHTEVRAAVAQATRTFRDVDVILLPTTPGTAPPAGAPVPPDVADFTALASATGLPALSVPVRTRAGGSGASVQLVGPGWSDPTLIALGAMIEDGAPR